MVAKAPQLGARRRFTSIAQPKSALPPLLTNVETLPSSTACHTQGGGNGHWYGQTQSGDLADTTVSCGLGLVMLPMAAPIDLARNADPERRDWCAKNRWTSAVDKRGGSTSVRAQGTISTSDVPGDQAACVG